MKVHPIDHVSININDLPAGKAFFLDLGLELQGEGSLEGARLDQIVGLNDMETTLAFFRVPDGQGPECKSQGQTNQANIKLVKYHTLSDEIGIQQPWANTLVYESHNSSALIGF